MNEDKYSNTLLAVAVVAVIVSMIGAGFTYYSIDSFKRAWLTGFASSVTASLNLSVETSADINFTTDNINWSSGRVNAGELNATLDTSAGTVSRGNWTARSQGFVLENIGNTNVTIAIKTIKDNATLLGGTNPQYWLNVSNNEPGSCQNQTSFLLGNWYRINSTVTSTGVTACTRLYPEASRDSIRIDIFLSIPSDAGVSGAVSDIMTATATANP